MKVYKGNKLIDISYGEFAAIKERYTRIEVDLGTGDGQFVYKMASTQPKTLVIGIDPAIKQVENFSRKCARNHIDNVLYVVGSIEILPKDLIGVADYLTVVLPWGTLLESIVNANSANMQNLKSLLKPEANFMFVLGYSHELEQSETQRLQLPTLNLDYLENQLTPKLCQLGFKNVTITMLTKTDLENLDSTWGKRVKETKDRMLFKITGNV